MLNLFRPEALKSQQVNWLGNVILIRPISFSTLTTLALLLTGLLVIFLVFGTYTKRSTVTGQVVPAAGQVKVHSPQYGVVVESFINEGDRLEDGSKLFRISSERYDSNSVPVHAGISQHLKQRRNAFIDELENLKRLHINERKNLESKVINIQNELSTLTQQIKSQLRRTELAADASNRYQGLEEQGYISTDQLQQRQAEQLGHQQLLHGFQREKTTMQQQLIEQRNKLASLEAHHTTEYSQGQRTLSKIKQELEENEARRTLIIKAPSAGIATAVLAEVGHTVDSSRPMLSIIPHTAQFQAELYIPTRAVGFIKVGDTVLIRYQSYPYQKFGQYKGSVLSISQTTVAPYELTSMDSVLPHPRLGGEQYYRIRVQLNQQNVLTYGKPRSLQTGMLLEADILQETRHLYEWALAPLYSLTGKFEEI